MRGLQNIIAADLTVNAIEITRRRCELYGVRAELREENAEQLSFADKTFDHINCQGVIHHTPNTDKAVSEIARVLKPGGTACVSVYYRNAALHLWPWLRWIGYPLTKLGGGLKGRGRERIFTESDVDEIVRRYDGSDNPIGKSYTRRQFQDLLERFFVIKEVYFHFFPARALPFSLPKRLHRWMDNHLPFMIYANLEKPCAG
jgi:SAM-dependent methyltransferase